MKSQFPELCLINQTWMDSVMCSCVWSCSLSKLTRISCFQQQGASFTCRQGWEMEYGAPMKQIMRTFPVNCWLSFCYMCVMSVGDLSSTHHVLWVSVDFSIQVLSSGSWPFQQSCTFALPTEVKLHLSWSRETFSQLTIWLQSSIRSVLSRANLQAWKVHFWALALSRGLCRKQDWWTRGVKELPRFSHPLPPDSLDQVYAAN